MESWSWSKVSTKVYQEFVRSREGVEVVDLGRMRLLGLHSRAMNCSLTLLALQIRTDGSQGCSSSSQRCWLRYSSSCLPQHRDSRRQRRVHFQDSTCPRNSASRTSESTRLTPREVQGQLAEARSLHPCYPRLEGESIGRARRDWARQILCGIGSKTPCGSVILRGSSTREMSGRALGRW